MAGKFNILFFGHKERGAACLKAVLDAGYPVIGVVGHPLPSSGHLDPSDSMAESLGFHVMRPPSANDPTYLETFRKLAPDLAVLAGFGQIVSQEFISSCKLGCLNLHAGKLPQYRGSSPLNWALINGEREFGLSIIQVDRGIDTGDILCERTFPIGPRDTIASLHQVANHAFPDMLIEVVEQIQRGKSRPRKQDPSSACYFPLRFPDDGFILWDLYTAEQVHNRIRALTEPYPGAFTFFRGKRVKLLASVLHPTPFHGEPGRVYKKGTQGLLVCASNRCLWVEKAILEENRGDLFPFVNRYDQFATMRGLVLSHLTSNTIS